MREKSIEKYFVEYVKNLGGEAEKFSSPNRRNVPDRLVTFPRRIIAFVEIKAPNKTLTPGQRRDHARRQVKSFKVYTVDSMNDARMVADLIARPFLRNFGE